MQNEICLVTMRFSAKIVSSIGILNLYILEILLYILEILLPWAT